MPFIVVCDLLFVPILCPIPFTVFEYRPVIIGEAKKILKKGDQKGQAGVSLTFLAVLEAVTQMFVSSCLKS